MLLGLTLQFVAILSWSSVLLTEGGVSRAVGVFGAVCAVVVIGLLLAFLNLSAHLVFGAILVQVLWYLGLAVTVARQGESLPRQV
jgi:hypothetical protein